MADRYWVGGTGAWSSTNTANWSTTSGGSTGASVPTAADNVFFDSLSNTGTTAFTVTMSVGPRVCLNFDASALDGVMTLAGASIDLEISGSYITHATNYSPTYTGPTSFIATTTGKTISSAVAFPGAVTFNGSGGAWTLNSSITVPNTSTTTLTQGTLALGTYNLTTGIFSSSNNYTRSIAFGTGFIVLNHSGAGNTVLSMAVVGAFTWTGTGGFSSAMTVTRTFDFGSSSGATAANAPNLYINSGASIPAFYSTGTRYNILDFTGSTSTNVTGSTTPNTLVLATGGAYSSFDIQLTGTTHTINANGNSVGTLVINTVGGTVTLTSAYGAAATSNTVTLTNGALALGGFNLTTGIFSSSNNNTRSIAFGSNYIILNHSGSGQTVLSMAVVGAFTWTGTGYGFQSPMARTATFDFGSSSGATAANAPNLYINSGASIPAFYSTGTRYNILDFTGSTSTNVTGSTTPNTLVLATGGAYSSLDIQLTGTTHTINANGNSVGTLQVNNSAGTVTLTSAYGTAATATSNTFTLTNGALVLNGFNLTTGIFSSSTTSTRSIAFGSNYIILNHSSAGQTVLAMAVVGAFTWTGTGGFSSPMARTATFDFGSSSGATAANAPNLYINSGASIPAFYSTGTRYNILDFTGSTSTNVTGSTTPNTLVLATGGAYSSLDIQLTGTTHTINAGGNSVGTLVINNSAGTVTLTSAYGAAATSNTVTLTTGALVLNGFNLTTGIFSSTGSGVRSITFGTNNIILAHTTAGNTVLAMTTATGFTYTGTGGFTSAMTVARTFDFGSSSGGTAANAPNLSITSGTAIPSFSSSFFNTLNFTGSSCTPATTTLSLNSLTLTAGGTYTSLTVTFFGTGTFTSTGKSIAALTINHSGTTTLADAAATIATGTTTLTTGTLALNGFDLTTGIFSSTNSNTRAIAFGTNNIILNHSGSGQTVLLMAIATGFTYTGTGGFTSPMTVTRTFSFGSTSGGTSSNAPNLSITSGSAVPSFTPTSFFNTLNFTGSTLTNADGTVTPNNLVLASGGTYTSFVVNFTGTTHTVNGNGNGAGTVTINNASGTVTLTGTYGTAATTTAFTLTAGTLALSGYNLTTGIFSSTNTNTRAIAFGTNNIILNHSGSGQTVLAMQIATGFTYTGTGGFTSPMTVTRTFSFGSTSGGTAANAPNLSITSGTAMPSFTPTSFFNTLNFTGSSTTNADGTVTPNNLVLASGGTYTSFVVNFTGTTHTVNGNGNGAGTVTINNAAGTVTLTGTYGTAATATPRTFTLTTGTLDLGGYNLTTGIFSSTNSNTRAITFGTNNIILNHSGAGQTVLAMAIATGFTYTGTGGFSSPMVATATFNFGATSGGTSSNAPNLSLTSGTAIPSFNTGSWFNTLSFTGSSTTPAAVTTVNVTNLTLSTGGTYTGLNVTFVSTGTYTSTGKTIAALTINHSGTTTLADAGSCTTYTQTTGTVNFATYNLTCSGAVAYTAGTLSNMGTITCTTWTIAAASTFTMTGGTITPSTSFVLTSGAFNFNGGTLNAPLFTHTAGTVTLGAAMTLPATSTYTLTAGTLTLGTYNLTTGIFSSTGNVTRSIAFGSNNIILAHTTAAQTVLSMAAASNFTYTGTGGFTSAMTVTRTFSFGSSVDGSTANAPNLSLTSGASIPTFTTGSWFNTLSFTGSSTTPAAATLNVANLTLSTGGTYTALGVTAVGTGTFTFTGKTIAAFVVNNGAGTTTFADAGSCTTYNQTAGTVNFATFNLTCSGTVAYYTGALSNTGTITCTTWSVTGTFTMTSGTITPSVSFVLTSGAFNYNGGTLSAVPLFTHTAGTVTLGQSYALTTNGMYTLTAGTLNLSGYNLTTGIFSSDVSTTRSILFGVGNIILTYNAGNTNVIYMQAATNFTWTGTGGFTATADTSKSYAFGNGSGGSAANAPNLTFTGSGTAIQYITTGTWWNTLNFGTTAFVFSVATLNVASLTLSSGGTYTALSVNATTTGTFTTAGKTIAALTVNNGAGTTTLANAVSCTTYTQTAGAVNFATYNLTCSGAVAYSAGTLSNIGTITCTTWTVTGTFTLTQGTITPSTSFVLTSGAFNYNGGTLSAVPTFTHTAGTVTLGQAYALTATGTYTLTTGTLSLGTYNLTTGIFSSTGTGTRAIEFGTGNIILAHTTAATAVLAMATATGFTRTGTGGFSSAMTVTRTFQFGATGGSTANAVNLSLTSGSSIPTFSTSSYFNTLDFTGSATTPATTTIFVNSLTLSTGGTYTSLIVTFGGTGTCTSTGKSLSGLIINSTSGTTTLADAAATTATGTTTLTSGTLALGGFDLTTGIFSSSNSTTRAIAFGTGNIILNNSSASVMGLDMATATGFTYTGTGGFSSAMTVARSFQFGSTTGGSTANAVNLSLTSGSSIPTITTASWFNALNFTGSTCTPTATSIFVNTLTLATGGTYTALIPTLTATQTWTPQFSKQLGGFSIQGTGITVTMGGSQSLVADATTTLTSGTLDLGGYDLTTGIFSSSNSNTRAIVFGTNNIILSHSVAATTILSMSTSTNFTYTGTGGFSSPMTVAATFAFGSATMTNAPNLALTSGSAVPTITTGSCFNALNFTGSTCTPVANPVYVNSLTLATGGTYTSLIPYFTATQTWTPQFSKQLGGFGIQGTGITVTMGGSQSLVATATTTLTSGTLDLGGYDLTTGIFSSATSSTRSIAFGTNNIILAHTSASQTVLSMATATGFTYTGTGGFSSAMTVTRTFSFGNSSGGSTTNAPNLSITSGSINSTITTGSYFGTLSFTGSSCTVLTTALNLNGLTLATGGSYTGITVTFVGTGTYTSTGKTIAALTINHSGTTTLADAGSCTTWTQTTGTVNFATYNLTCSGAVSYTAGTLSNMGTVTCTSWTIAAASTFTMTSGTITPSTSFVLTSGAFNYDAGTLNAPLFTHTAGTVTLGQALTTTGTYTMTAGTLSLGSSTLTCDAFSSANNNVRTIAFGTGNITVTGSGTVWTTTTVTNLTITGSRTVNVTNATATATTVIPGSLTEAQAIDFNFTAGTYELTFLNGLNHNARTVNFTGYSGSWLHGGTCILYGSITYSNTMSVTDASRVSAGITFGATSGTQTLTPGLNVPIAPIVMNCSGATLAIATGSVAIVSSSNNNYLDLLTLTNGTLNLNGGTISVNRCITATGTKNITFNGGTLLCRSIVTGTSNNGFYNEVPTNFSTTAGTGTGYIAMYGGHFEGGGSTYNCTLQMTGSTTIVGSNTFTGIQFNPLYSGSLLFAESTTTTVTNWSVYGLSPYYVTLDTSTGSGTFTLSKASGTVNSYNLSIIRSTATGGANWYAGASIDNGSNSGWIFTYPPTDAKGSFLAFFDDEAN